MKLVIWTQFEENYGAHDWNGEGACPQYWKCKGGDVYVVESLTEAQAAKIDVNGIPTLTSLIDRADDYCRDTVTNYSLVEDDSNPWREWESPTYLRYERGAWRARRVVNGADSGYHQSVKQKIIEYTLLPSGEQQDRTDLYVTDKGALTHDEWMAAYASNEPAL